GFFATVENGGAPTSICPTYRWAIVHPTAASGRWRNVMGISQYDPAAAGKPAWNAGRQVGATRSENQTDLPARTGGSGYRQQWPGSPFLAAKSQKALVGPLE